jgi:hypothetical protein
MGKAMVNAINLVVHVTIVAHLNLKLLMTKVTCHGPVVAFVIKYNSCCAAMWHIINGMMKTLNPNTCKVGPCDTWRFKLSKY